MPRWFSLLCLTACASTHDADDDAGGTAAVVINEFLAYSGGEGYARGADWIELYNAGDATEDLTGMFLASDDGNRQTDWGFPDGTLLEPGAFLVVVCDETGAWTGARHATFAIERHGGEILLYDAEHTIDHILYGEQATGISSARVPDGSLDWATGEPTPGESNGD